LNEILQAVGRALQLDAERDLNIERVLATHIRSEVVVIRTRLGERVIAKRFLESDADLRFEAESTALRGLADTAAPVPHFRGEDRKSLVLVMEALDGSTVEDVIRGNDREEAARGLVAYANAIGLLHLVGRDAALAIGRAREERGYDQSRFWPPFARDPRGAAARLAAFTDAPRDPLADEIAYVVARTFEAPGADATLIQWDCWPGNAIGPQDRVVLVDLENSMFGAALVDVSSWHLAFPPAPLVLPLAGLIPDELIRRMDRAYVEASGREITTQDLAPAVASRMLFELTAPSAPKLMSGSLDAGIRALYAFRLMRASELVRQASVLPVLASTMVNIAAKARPSDPATAQPLPYPALAD